MGSLAVTYGDSSGGTGYWTVFAFVWLAFFVLYAIAGWKMYEKAGRQGWEALIPIYNIYVLLKIVGRPGWWLLLFLIPFVNLVVWIIVALDLAKSFGQGVGFAIGLIFLSFIFVLILGFGEARYLGPAAQSTPPLPPMPS